MAGGKEYVDANATAILDKWRRRLAGTTPPPQGAELTASDLIRHLDVAAEREWRHAEQRLTGAERRQKDRDDDDGRRLIVG